MALHGYLGTLFFITSLIHVYLQLFSEIIETTAKNGVVPIAKQCKTLLKDNVVRFKMISLYVYKDLRHLGLMSHVTIVTRMAT